MHVGNAQETEYPKNQVKAFIEMKSTNGFICMCTYVKPKGEINSK